MTKKGGLTAKFYKETKGLKTSGGQSVLSGTILTREGHKWQQGLNGNGKKMHLTAGCDGEVYFTRKKNPSRKVVTYVNIKPSAEDVK